MTSISITSELLSTDSPIIKMDHVFKTYGQGESKIFALNDVSLEIFPGQVITVMGPSGSGKSTLMHMLGAMDSPSSGKIWVDNIEISQLPESKLSKFRRFSVGFIFQNFYLLPNVDVLNNILSPNIPFGITDEDRMHARELLKAVGLEQREKEKVRVLSGGQSQRIAIARSLINNPNVILADEPTGNLDSETGRSIIDLLLKFADQGKTILIVTHDPRVGHLVSEYKKGRNLWMQDGKLGISPTYNQNCW